jgi:3,4-dihydroxy-2-butanone 4-phosphate synthase
MACVQQFVKICPLADVYKEVKKMKQMLDFSKEKGLKILQIWQLVR